VGRGPLVGHGILLVGRQAFFILLKMIILDTYLFHKLILKIHFISYKIIKKQQNKLIYLNLGSELF